MCGDIGNFLVQIRNVIKLLFAKASIELITGTITMSVHNWRYVSGLKTFTNGHRCGRQRLRARRTSGSGANSCDKSGPGGS